MIQVARPAPANPGRSRRPHRLAFGISQELNTSWGLHASLSERSRFPALRELYSGALNRFTPNPDLKPETLMALEGGFTLSAASGTTRSTLQVTGFRHALEDAVVRITLANPTRFMRVNRDRIESAGAEYSPVHFVRPDER